MMKPDRLKQLLCLYLYYYYVKNNLFLTMFSFKFCDALIGAVATKLYIKNKESSYCFVLLLEHVERFL